MKKNKNLIATMLVFSMLLLASIGGMSVFAEEVDTPSAISETGEEDLSAVGDAATQTTVSGCDLKKEDLSNVKVKQYGFSMLIPNGYLTTIESETSAFDEIGYSRPYFIEQGCIMQVFTEGENYCAVSLFVDELSSLYDYYGNYSSLSKEQQDELINDAVNDSEDVTAEFVKINGRTYLETSLTDLDEDTGDVYSQYQFTTVIDGRKYELYIQALNATDSDKAVINEMINSIKLNGMGVKLSAMDVTLIVVCIILVLAVAIAYFFIFRANEFVKSGIREFSPIGFDLPKEERIKKFRSNLDDEDDEDEYDDDEESDYEDDDESDDEDESDDDDDDEDESDDDDDDDERIIKD